MVLGILSPRPKSTELVTRPTHRCFEARTQGGWHFSSSIARKRLSSRVFAAHGGRSGGEERHPVPDGNNPDSEFRELAGRGTRAMEQYTEEQLKHLKQGSHAGTRHKIQMTHMQ